VALPTCPDTLVLSGPSTGSVVTYHPNYLSQEQADSLLSAMIVAPWETETPIVFGKPRQVKRKTCAFGNAGLSYSYSGMRKEAHAWPMGLDFLRATLMLDTGARFNFALANLYPDGEAGIGAHADDEPEIVKDSPIVGISLGSTRDFFLTDKEGHRVAGVALEHGSAIVMWGSTQRHYKHAVPPRKRVKSPRVSLTFRVMSEK
jgi:alkylated DNA repair dioxygenase AlkB